MGQSPDRQIERRTYVSYIDKSREYYQAQGFEHPYRWAAFDDVPFASLAKPITECRVAVVTTSFPHYHESAFGAPATDKVVYHRSIDDVPERMFTDDLGWDKVATHTNDTESFLPLRTLRGLVEDGVVGSLSHRFFGVPTEYSQRRSGVDARVVTEWCREDEVDIALLVPL